MPPDSASPKGWDKKTRDTIKATIAAGMPDAEFARFEHLCLSRGLDPLLNEVHAMHRKGSADGRFPDQWTFVTAINGLLKICAPALDGLAVTFYGSDGKATDIWLADSAPAACKAVVYRKGCTHGFEGQAIFREYTTGKSTWTKMPSVMIRKCAIAAALRTAFADLIGGLYEAAEMDQSNFQAASAEASPAPAQPPAQPMPVVIPNSEQAPAAKPAATSAPTRVAPPQPKPEVNNAAIAAAVAPISESNKNQIVEGLNSLAARGDGSVQAVIAGFKEKAGFPDELEVTPAEIKTEQHAQILLGLLTPYEVINNEIPF